MTVEATWLNAVSGAWSDPTKWSSNPDYPNNGTPAGTTYHAFIAASGSPYTVTLDAAVAVGTVTLDNTSATLAIGSGRSLDVSTRLDVGGTIVQTAGTLSMPNSATTLGALRGNALFQQSGGTFSFGRVFAVGALAGDSPRYEMSGTGLLDGQQINVGTSFGNGTFVQSGGTVRLLTSFSASPYLALGDSDLAQNIKGYYELSGGTLTTNNEYVGASGVGTFVQSGGYNVIPSNIASNFLLMGDDSTATGTYHLSGGTLQTNAIVLGHFGSGTLLQTGGRAQVSGVVRVGRDFGSKGYYSLAGASSVLSTGEVDVGYSGTGTFVQSGGTYTTTDTLYVAKNSLSTGTYLLSDGTLAVPNASVGAGGAGTFSQTGGRFTVNGSLQIFQNGNVFYNGGSLLVSGTLDVQGGRLSESADGARLLRVGAVNITGANGVVDLNDNDLIVAGGTGKATVENYVKTARNSGAWNGLGITSTAARDNPIHTTGLGVLGGLEYASLGNLTFDGIPTLPTDVLVKYTYNGDANFDGRVTFDDYTKIDTGFNIGLSGWLNGDFNYSGTVTFDDYVLIDTAFNQQNGTLQRAIDWVSGDDRSGSGRAVSGVQEVIEHLEQFGSAYGQAFLAAVPEPGFPVLVCLPVIFRVFHRCRQRRGPRG